ncbi:MAG TPA: hypothetical protein VFN67_01935 [Polyangiales bacterium]|nr:hypothetical protein [Polyangiales bacterium]
MLLRLRSFAFVLVISGLSAAATVGVAHAQNNQVEAGFKGTVGLGLVGAELGAVIPALAGLDATWAYIVFPVVGAAGGGLAGYFAIDNADKVELSVVALTAGMALVLPALIATLQLTSYDDDDQPPPPGGFARSRKHPGTMRRVEKQLAAGPGMLRMSEGRLAFQAPGVALLPGARGESPVSGVNLALMSGRF